MVRMGLRQPLCSSMPRRCGPAVVQVRSCWCGMRGGLGCDCWDGFGEGVVRSGCSGSRGGAHRRFVRLYAGCIAAWQRWLGGALDGGGGAQRRGVWTDPAAVSWSSMRACTAVGSFTDGQGARSRRSGAGTGVSWSVQSTPHPWACFGGGLTLTDVSLDHVSCGSRTACMAVGSIEQAVCDLFCDGSTSPLVERWNGARR